jgi:hypothetical protein
MSLSTGAMNLFGVAEKPVIPGNFSDRARAALWNNAAIPRIPFYEPGKPGSHA